MVDGAEIRDAGPKPELGWLPVSRLFVDDRYQRDMESRASQKLIARIEADFNWSAFQVIVVTGGDERGWAIIDGQHRVEVARRRGETHVPAVIVVAAGIEQQARIFVSTNRDRVSVNAFALHHALLAAGDAGALRVQALCELVGLSIPRYPVMASRLKPGQTLALATLGRLIEDAGEEVAELAAGAVAAAYAEKPWALRAVLFRAVAAIVGAAAAREDAALGVGKFLRATEPAALFAGVRTEMQTMLINEQMALERALKRGMAGRQVDAPEAPLTVPVAATAMISRPHPRSTPSQILDEEAYDEHRLQTLIRNGAPIARIAAAFKMTEDEVRRVAGNRPRGT